MNGSPRGSPKFFMWVAVSPLFSRRRGPHIKIFKVGSEMGDARCISLCLCVFFLLLKDCESERPRCLLLSLGVAIQTPAWVRSWVRSRSHPRSERVPSRFDMCFSKQHSRPMQVRGGGHPGLSWSLLVPSVESGMGLGRAETDFLATSK